MLIFKNGAIEIYEMPAHVAKGYPPCTEFYVYEGDKLARVCPSVGMAHEVAAGL